MKDALLFIVSSIIEDSEHVSVDEQENDGIIEFIIHVPKEEIGKVIGKEGKIIRALRNVLKIPAMKQNKKIHISISE